MKDSTIVMAFLPVVTAEEGMSVLPSVNNFINGENISKATYINSHQWLMFPFLFSYSTQFDKLIH